MCGADEVHRYDEPSWGEPVDLVLDAAGGEVTQRCVNALAPRGGLVALAANSGAVDTGSLLGGLKTVTGFSIGLLSREDPTEIDRRRAELWRLHADKQLQPRHITFPFDQVAEALDLVSARANAGRVVLRLDLP